MTRHLETFARVMIGPPVREWFIFDVRVVDGELELDEVRRAIWRAYAYEKMAEGTRR